MAEEGFSICAACKTDASSKPLKDCTRCGNVAYCSRACKQSDWETHKKTCNKARGAKKQSSMDLKLEPFWYYNQTAHTVPEAKRLAESLGLTLPIDGCEGLMKPVRRLVVTGMDTEENLRLFFGPDWAKMMDIHEQARMYALITPAPGSAAHALSGWLDQGCPFWSPRPASEAEKEKLRMVEEVKAVMASHFYLMK